MTTDSIMAAVLDDYRTGLSALGDWYASRYPVNTVPTGYRDNR